MLINRKKASLEISIQAIIIIVLAMTLLGLGLGFIRGMFKSITSTTEDVTEQVREQILNDLRTGDKKISFPKTEIIIEKGQSTMLNVGIRNKENAVLGYSLKFTPISYPDPTNSNIIISNNVDIDGRVKTWFQVVTPLGGYWNLGQSESDIRSIRISIPKGTTSGSYALTFSVMMDQLGGASQSQNTIYDQKDFFIVVIG